MGFAQCSYFVISPGQDGGEILIGSMFLCLLRLHSVVLASCKLGRKPGHKQVESSELA